MPSQRKGITLICPICGESWLEPSIESLMEKARKAWHYWRPLPEGIEKQIREWNNPERIKRILKEKGFLSAFCNNCALATTVASAKTILEVR